MGQIIHKPKRWTPLNIEKNPLNLPKVVIPPLHFLNPLFVVIQLWKKKKKKSKVTPQTHSQKYKTLACSLSLIYI